jgi:hypothetical protein
MRGTAYTSGGVYGPSALTHSPSKDIKGVQKKARSGWEKRFFDFGFFFPVFRANPTPFCFYDTTGVLG